jgi:hypothetical protein
MVSNRALNQYPKRHLSGLWQLLPLILVVPLFTSVTALAEQRFPDVIAVKVQPKGTATFDFDVTVSSPYDTPERYADAFRVTGKDGKVLGERNLMHDHASEQPFTRGLYGVKIPLDIRMINVQARDQRFGYGGKSVEVILPGR